jgi:competence ComEA-like helix-hairpin-helix protein
MSQQKFVLIRYLCVINISLFLLGFSLAATVQAQERINLNTASVAELMRLPFVGQAVAQRIVAYRHKHGPFKHPQEVIIIKGLSAKRYRQIAHLIRI